MDMFFAAVEIKKNPQLAGIFICFLNFHLKLVCYTKDKPVAVGSLQMISTSNYVARQFGGMLEQLFVYIFNQFWLHF